VLAQEAALVAGADRRVETGVVGQGLDPVGSEVLGGGLDLATRQAVDDAGLASMAIDEIQELAASVVLALHAVADVGPVEGTGEPAGIFPGQAVGELAPGRRVRGPRQG